MYIGNWYGIAEVYLLYWRHSVEQVYLGYNHNKSKHRVRIACLSSMEGGRVRNNFLRKLSYVYTCFVDGLQNNCSTVSLCIHYLCLYFVGK